MRLQELKARLAAATGRHTSAGTITSSRKAAAISGALWCAAEATRRREQGARPLPSLLDGLSEDVGRFRTADCDLRSARLSRLGSEAPAPPPCWFCGGEDFHYTDCDLLDEAQRKTAPP